jgi:hypothetical protein
MRTGSVDGFSTITIYRGIDTSDSSEGGWRTTGKKLEEAQFRVHASLHESGQKILFTKSVLRLAGWT